VVPQAYFEAVSHGTDLSQYNLFQIYGLYLQSLPDFNTFHLWFLVDLFLICIVTIPLFLFRNSSGRSPVARLSAYFSSPWALLSLLVISILIVNVFLPPEGFWGNKNGGWSIISYLLFFVFGYFIVANPRIMETIKKIRRVSLGIALVTALGLLFVVSRIGDPAAYFGTPLYAGASLVQSLCCWGGLLAILGFGSLYLNRNNRVLEYANEAVLPFYILHQTIIIVIGFYVVQWDSGIWLKYLVISVSSFMGIMLIYELLVKRINVLRFLFGMKSKRKLQAAPVPVMQNATDLPSRNRIKV
jgi:glucans biosynthesis protein C